MKKLIKTYTQHIVAKLRICPLNIHSSSFSGLQYMRLKVSLVWINVEANIQTDMQKSLKIVNFKTIRFDFN